MMEKAHGDEVPRYVGDLIPVVIRPIVLISSGKRRRQGPCCERYAGNVEQNG